jgi:hypothetical protein
MSPRQTFLVTEGGALSAADMLLSLLGMRPEVVDGPATRIASNLEGASIPRAAFERAKTDAVSSIGANKRLPAAVWIGAEALDWRLCGYAGGRRRGSRRNRSPAGQPGIRKVFLQ